MRDKNEMLVDASLVQTFYAMLTTPIDRRAVRLAQDVIALVGENDALQAQFVVLERVGAQEAHSAKVMTDLVIGLRAEIAELKKEVVNDGSLCGG